MLPSLTAKSEVDMNSYVFRADKVRFSDGPTLAQTQETGPPR